MRRPLGVVLVALLAAACVPEIADPRRVSEAGIGPVHFGMTLDEASQAWGTPFEPAGPAPSDAERCYTVYPGGSPDAPFALMVNDGQIARIDVWALGFDTAEGIGIGSREADIRGAYRAEALTVSQREDVPDGRYYIVSRRPGHQIIFEIEGDGVGRYRAGRVPEVNYVEACV